MALRSTGATAPPPWALWPWWAGTDHGLGSGGGGGAPDAPPAPAELAQANTPPSDAPDADAAPAKPAPGQAAVKTNAPAPDTRPQPVTAVHPDKPAAPPAPPA